MLLLRNFPLAMYVDLIPRQVVQWDRGRLIIELLVGSFFVGCGETSFDSQEPIFDRVEGLPICHVVAQENARCPVDIKPQHLAARALPAYVPHLRAQYKSQPEDRARFDGHTCSITV
jgi:hypothetical protein